MADFVSRASRQGKAIAGLEASAGEGVTFWDWKRFWCFVVGVEIEVVDNCRAQDVRGSFEGREAIRAAAKRLRVGFMVLYIGILVVEKMDDPQLEFGAVEWTC